MHIPQEYLLFTLAVTVSLVTLLATAFWGPSVRPQVYSLIINVIICDLVLVRAELKPDWYDGLMVGLFFLGGNMLGKMIRRKPKLR